MSQSNSNVSDPENLGPRLDRVLSTTGRVRIIQFLSHHGETNLTEISRKTSQSYAATARHLRTLCETNMVSEKDYGRIRMFRLKTENDQVRRLRDFIINWDKTLSSERSANAQA